ncbi:MAG TPA: DUF3883 domain-containing protein [Planctomycetota bacterium]|nr:DUF3883 domain-containing protein [Planctomycetota bacterium]
MTSTGELVAAEGPATTARLLAHHPRRRGLGNLDKIFRPNEIVFLHRAFQLPRDNRRQPAEETERRGRVKEFLRGIFGVREMEPYHIIREVALPRLQSDDGPALTERRVVQLTNYIRENLRSYVGRFRKDHAVTARERTDDAIIREEIGSRLRLLGCYREGGQVATRMFPCQELYLARAGGKPTAIAEMFEGAEGVPFVSDAYSRPGRRLHSSLSASRPGGHTPPVPSWDEFFCSVRVWATPRLVGQQQEVRWHFDSRFDIWEGHSHCLANDHVLPEFDFLLKRYAQAGDEESRHEAFSRLERFARLIGDAWRRLYEPLAQADHSWHHYSPKSRKVAATFLQHLRTSPWLPVRRPQESLIEPSQGFLDSAHNRILLPQSTPLVDDTYGHDFLNAIGVSRQPDRQLALAGLRELAERWHGDQFQKSWQEQTIELYKFLSPSKAPAGQGDDDAEVLRAFSGEALFFTPIEGRLWWPRDKVFWQGPPGALGGRRVYLSDYYPTDLRGTFLALGVAENPSLGDCLAVLEEIKRNWLTTPATKADTRRVLRGQIDLVYGAIEGLLPPQPVYMTDRRGTASTEDAALARLRGAVLFLADSGRYYAGRSLVYFDDERLREALTSSKKIHLLELHTDWRLYRRLFQTAGILAASSRVVADVLRDDPQPVPSEEEAYLRGLADLLELYVQHCWPESHQRAMEAGVFDRIREVAVQTVRSLGIRYRCDGQLIGSHPNLDAWYDTESGILYVLQKDQWLLGNIDDISQELASILSCIGQSLKAQIESLLAPGFDEHARLRKLEGLGVPRDLAARFAAPAPERVLEGQTIEEGEYAGTDVGTPVAPTGQTVSSLLTLQIGAQVPPKVEVEPKVERLLDPASVSEFVVSEGGERKTLSPPSSTRRRREDRAPRPPRGVDQKVRPSTATGAETEAVAIALAIQYERAQDRNPKDYHDQPGLGYDLESSGRYIEVKSSKSGEPLIVLTDLEWKAAKEKGPAYYVYVITGLIEGHEPRIRVLENPAQRLQFRLAGTMQAVDWKSRVSEDIRCHCEPGHVAE